MYKPFRRYTSSIFCVLSIIFLKFSSILEKHEILINYVFYFAVLECCGNNQLLQISAIYGFLVAAL